jgi:hypothetical protein
MACSVARYGIVLLLLALLSGNALGADEQIVQQVSGNGSRNLRPFTVKDHWEIRWDSKGPALNISVRQNDGELVQGGGSQREPGKGATYQPKGGTYFLDVMGMGDWTITVVQLP